MDAKLNHSDLIALLSKTCGVSLADAEAFSTAFFELIVEGLESDGIVKINGLGTFRITSVESRESVNVNTGERFEIKGHKKLSFTPAESLKETINAPFAMFEPVEVDEEIDEETEVMPLDTDIEAEDVSETNIEPESENAPTETPAMEYIEEEMPAQEQENQVVSTPFADVVEEEQPFEDIVEQPAVVMNEEQSEFSEEPHVEDEELPEEQKESEKESEPEDKASAEIENESEDAVEMTAPQDVVSQKDTQLSDADNGNTAKRTVFFAFVAVLFVAIAFGLYHLSGDDTHTSQITAQEKKAVENTTAVTENRTVVEDVAADSAAAEKVEEFPAFVLIDTLAKRNLAVITLKDTTDYAIRGSITEHIVELDETLIKISLKHYGDKRLWPYIVQYNKLSQPNDLACGMVLKIPCLVPRN